MVAPEKLANDYQSRVTLSCGDWMAASSAAAALLASVD
jgi:hypothetical protein